MRLADLFPTSHFTPHDAECDVGGLSFDSRTTQKNDVFFAVPGTKGDGRNFISDALNAGACALVGQDENAAFNVPYVRVANVRLALAQAAARFYPAQPSTILAVTGTSGKTSVASFVRQIMSECGHQAAAIGTTGVIAPSGRHYGALTTPDPITLHKICDELTHDGVTHVALEASSHGLDQYRLDGLRISAAAFTNLSHDHLDYHMDMDDYLNAKLGLFRRLLKEGQTAVINADDAYSNQVIAACAEAHLHILTTGFRGQDLILRSVDMTDQNATMTFDYRGVSYSAHLALVGDFMIANVMVAMGLCLSAGEKIEAIVAALPKLVGAPGRLERVAMMHHVPIYVDYAHKPDALDKVLRTLRALVKSRLILVFGCGGDRDRAKRGEMGAIAQSLADVVIVTDDNPRNEDPASIRAAICAKAPSALNIGDREQAIRHALEITRDGDVVLIAGKGHEEGQIIGSQVLPFSDHNVVRSLVQEMTR